MVSAMIFALIAPEFVCITGSTGSIAKVSVSVATAQRLGTIPPATGDHASCLAHVAVANKPVQAVSSSAPLDLLKRQAEEIQLHYSVLPYAITPLIKPEKWLSAQSPEQPLSLSLVAVKSTVLLI